MHHYEKLGAFYLGRGYDLERNACTEDPILYDARDLTTHAVCVGMTGSGKTGLCVSLLEEAAIDGIPAIAIDPKGDLGNLMLTFPDLDAASFRPWIDEAEAARKGMTPDAYAADRAALWRSGLESWDQDGARIARFRDAVDIAIYTPGSSAGLPISVLQSFTSPPPALSADRDAMRERVSASVSGLLALLGIDADPIRSREHILLSNIVDHAWRAGRDLDIAALIHEIQNPGFDRIGVMDLDSFFPARDRFALAMSLNNLLASPGFGAWMEGEPLDAGKLLYTPDGRPRLSVLSIAHLNDTERMFFVTLLLNEVVSWMRAKSGTSSLRAILYMDEIFGFFPPVANPPSKTPMLTLLKQARAYGLGVVLATQNPVDLDYKGLSNTGTWFLGRLQTERDKARVLDGLEGASAASGARFDRARLDTILSGLGSRVFVMHNVHENEPVLMHTRWALSYLRGPLTRTQIQTLMAPRRQPALASPEPAAPAHRPPRPVAVETPATAAAAAAAAPPPLDPDIERFFLPLTRPRPSDATLVYRPTLIGIARMHFVRLAAGVDMWRGMSLLAPLDEPLPPDLWAAAETLPPPRLEAGPDDEARYGSVPAKATRPKSYRSWKKGLIDFIYRKHEMTLYKSTRFKHYSEPNETEGDFRVRIREIAHEVRDEKIATLRERYDARVATLKDRIRRAEQKVEVETAQYKEAGFSTAVSLGSTVLDALFGRKTRRSTGTTARRAGRTARQRGDIGRAKESLEALHERLADEERKLEADLDELRRDAEEDTLALEAVTVRPRKSDMTVERLALAWAPHFVRADGGTEPAYERSGDTQ